MPVGTALTPINPVFQKEHNTVARRRHVHLWRRGSWEGQALWAAAGTHDIGVKFAVRDRSFTHRVEQTVDLERDQVVNDLGSLACRPRPTRIGRRHRGRSSMPRTTRW
ncbi:MAG: LssY C-terminal domain-containing protein [Acidobacteriota bacterium]|nr:LssY C-terminal domain-containing protein [Acidobacteriota bacterium]